MKEKVVKQFKEILENHLNENEIQEYLEKNTELIATPFLLNHGLHFDVVLSKLKICDGLISDFAYLTKSSDFWHFVLVEIEDPRKRLFNKDLNRISFSAEFNNAYDQVLAWKAYVESNKEDVLKKIRILRTPIAHTPVRIKYVLVIGRNDEKNRSERKTALFAQKSTEDIRVLTFDSLISDYLISKENNREKIVLSHWREGFKIKSVPQDIQTSIFAYLSLEYLAMDSDIRNKLLAASYDIEKWEDGKPLIFNGKNVGFGTL